jgi:PAS domain S-box-containing protein
MPLENLTPQPKENNFFRILLIDDDEDDYLITRQMLAEARQGRFLLEWASGYEAGEARLAEDPSFDAVIVDYRLGARSGIDLIRQVVARQYPAPVLLLTGQGAYAVDVEAMQAGVAEYLSKDDINPTYLERAVRYAIERKKQEISIRNSEAHLLNSEERYRRLFTSMLNGFAVHEIICDADGKAVDYRFLEVNPAFEQMTGLKAADVLGKTVREVLPGIDAVWIETYGRVALTGEAVQFEDYATPLQKYYQVYAFCPQVNQFAALFSDITPRKQMEAELLQAQAVSHTGSWRLDVRQDTLTWSEETYRIFDVPVGTPLSYGSFLAFVHPEDREQVDCAWTAALNGASYDLEHRILAGEQVKWVRERAVLEFDAQGALHGGFGTVQDITEQRRMQLESVKHQIEAEVHHHLLALREKEHQQLARHLHDGPLQFLSGIIFHLQSLREGISDPPVQLELDTIRAQIKTVVKDLRGMMNELRPPALIRFGLGKAIQSHVQELLERRPDMEVLLDLQETGSPLPENINLTLFRIYQEAVNNAIHHGEATTIWVRYHYQSDHALLEVSDNGGGFAIPEDWGLQTQTGHFGLPGMKERTDMLGGQLSIYSKPGQGTTVQVTIPL